MPDGDVFTRSVSRRWRSVATALSDGLSVDECARRIQHSLATDLREAGGFARPGLEDLLNAGTANQADIANRLGELVRNEVFERVMPLLVAKGTFASVEQARQFATLCIETARMDLLARSLVSHPDGRGLRRPGRKKSSNRDLLSEPASLGGRA